MQGANRTASNEDSKTECVHEVMEIMRTQIGNSYSIAI